MLDSKKDGKRLVRPLAYPMRVNRYLAWRKICSRHEADPLIKAGQVTINGRAAQPGDWVEEGDVVRVSGQTAKQLHYLAYHKPRGIITHSPQAGERSIEQLLKFKDKVYPLGRLDKDSRGLIILSNDGRLTGRLLEPEQGHEKEYLVTVDQPIDEAFISRLTDGVVLDDGYRTKPCQAKRTGEKKFSIILTEGKKRQIRRMCQALGRRVVDLKRVRIMNIRLGGLAAGQYREIRGEELRRLLRAVGLDGKK